MRKKGTSVADLEFVNRLAALEELRCVPCAAKVVGISEEAMEIFKRRHWRLLSNNARDGIRRNRGNRDHRHLIAYWRTKSSASVSY